MELVRKKTTLNEKLTLILFSPIFLLCFFVGYLVGFVWGFMNSGFIRGGNSCAKITGYETTEEMIDRKVDTLMA